MAEAATSRTPRNVLREEIEHALRGIEDAFEQLKKPRDAWRTLCCKFNGAARPIWSYDVAKARETLGWPEYRVDERPKKAKLTAFRELKRLAREIKRAEVVTDDVALRRAIERNPALYGQHTKEWQKYGPVVRTQDAWRLAYIGSQLAASLDRLDDPLATFAAGRALEEYRLLRHQQDLMAKERRKVKAAGQAALSQAGAKGGARGRGRAKVQHGELIDRVVERLHERVAVNPGTVRDALKTVSREEGQWRILTYEWGDPLKDLVGVTVQDDGTVLFEYTAKWALKRNRNDRFVKLDPKKLKAAIDRALERVGKANKRNTEQR